MEFQTNWLTSVVVVVVLVCSFFVTGAHTRDTICDWHGSGLDQDEPGVQPVPLGCSQGRVRWRWPRGALRLRLGPGRGRDFRACVAGNSRWPAGVRLSLEEPRGRLLPLLDASATASPPTPRCFRSRAGRATLYLEAEPPREEEDKETDENEPYAKNNTTHRKRRRRRSTDINAVAELAYDIHPLGQKDPLQGSEYSRDKDMPWFQHDCRPCTDDELVHYFCTSDFVIEGRLLGSRDDDAGFTALTVLSVAVHRDASPPLFSSSSETVLRVPSRCGARHGAGIFVLLGRRALGRVVLSCAPRLERWSRLVDDPQWAHKAPCRLHFSS